MLFAVRSSQCALTDFVQTVPDAFLPWHGAAEYGHPSANIINHTVSNGNE